MPVTFKKSAKSSADKEAKKRKDGGGDVEKR